MLNFSKQRIDKMVPQDRLYSLRALKTPSAGKILAKWLIGIMLIFVLVLFLPWQQNIRGTGKMTALNPMNRPQTVQAVIAGQIRKWHVREGQFINKGDTIITISEVKEKYFDPKLLFRLEEQINAKEGSIGSKEQKANALRRQITALRDAMRIKIEQSQAKLEAEKFRFQNAENQFQRNKKLFAAGNIPLTKFQDIEYKYQGSQADYLNAKIELDRVEAEYLDKISKAESELSNTQADLFDSQAEVSKLRNEFANMQIRNNQYQVLSPQNGYVVKAMMAGIGETIKEGDAVCTIMPQASDMAVELYVKAMDVPLLSKGRSVRVEFDGWPALQFSGWPSVSVGTFGGRVEVIDYVNSKPGEFRVLVIPDTLEQAWPSQLRVGSGIKGWVMLDDVPVWYEIWRQLNGFPPSLYEEPLDEAIQHNSNSTGGKKGK
ncbi:MAG: HlyD family efflux transporter periplasmic adaptor subunit [Cyclobacteriaceae bacterium]|nr:HlyD family efflux transporter periplasmic adaptor subunit [Cyclobacteriaceae bacterium]MDH4295749.1 HlyD family efflux transporter periplasmic adaptor subunit [Cyclobacteriaceae bacterium]MDH5249575.1 HlyD family efflux transporter periplasmic adaptor subunit [Cyclobacteriaceae bacterium]